MDAITGTCTACGHELLPPEPRQPGTEVFRQAGDYWAIRFEGRSCNVRDGKGLRYLAQLLRSPGRKLYALDLMSSVEDQVECCHEACDGDAWAASERARISVTRAIRRAQARISACHPSLGQHFETTIRTGTYCAYIPDSRVPTVWEITVQGFGDCGGPDPR